MAMSRKTKKLLKTYASWKALKGVSKFGVLPAVGMLAYSFWKNRRDAETLHTV